jgi:peptidoglycan/LPS O-acetylase OafA/YrhL
LAANTQQHDKQEYADVPACRRADVRARVVVMTAPAAPRIRLDTLTGLRALAAGVVFLKHATAILPTRTADDVAQVIGVCLVVVSFFFLLSGFVLSWVWQPGDTARAFYRRRMARVLPNYTVTWLVGGLLTLVALQLTPGNPGEALTSFLLGLVLLQSWVPVEGVALGINGVAWTLSCEIFFYALLPLMIGPIARMSARSRWSLIALSTVTVTALPLVIRPDAGPLLGMSSAPLSTRALIVYALPIARLPEFVIGCCLAFQIKEGWRPRISLGLATVLAITSFVVAGVVRSGPSIAAVTLIPFTLLIAAAAACDLSGRASPFGGRWWRRLGDWSFAFYVVHQLVIRVVIAVVDRVGTPSIGVDIALALLCLVISLTVSAVMFRRLERPMEQRWRTRRSRVSSNPSVPAPAAVPA